MKTTLRIFAKIALTLIVFASIAMTGATTEDGMISWVNIAALATLCISFKGLEALEKSSEKSNK